MLNVHKQVIESVKVEVLLGRPKSRKCKEGDIFPYIMNVYEGEIPYYHVYVQVGM